MLCGPPNLWSSVRAAVGNEDTRLGHLPSPDCRTPQLLAPLNTWAAPGGPCDFAGFLEGPAVRHRAVCSSGHPASLEYLCQETGSFWKVLPAQAAGSISRQAGGLFFTLSSFFQSKREHGKRAGRSGLAGWGLLVAVTAVWRGGRETFVLTNQPISTETAGGWWHGGRQG